MILLLISFIDVIFYIISFSVSLIDIIQFSNIGVKYKDILPLKYLHVNPQCNIRMYIPAQNVVFLYSGVGDLTHALRPSTTHGTPRGMGATWSGRNIWATHHNHVIEIQPLVGVPRRRTLYSGHCQRGIPLDPDCGLWPTGATLAGRLCMARWNSRQRAERKAKRLAAVANPTTQPATGVMRSTWDRSTTKREQFQGSSQGLAKGILADDAALRYGRYERPTLGHKKTGKGLHTNERDVTFIPVPELIPDKDTNRPTPKSVKRVGYRLVPKGRKTWSDQ